MLLTIPQTREFLGGVSESFVYGLIADGDLPTVDIARRSARKSKTRIPRKALEEWLESRTTTPKKNRKNGGVPR
ncbi:helix-turn-helix domain-containing protein [Planobispora rosea]|uniref:helix-turn-helix domain-containing protein n=1 Tax=Planobispora rosea TaxID=35762 RepID=UPI00083A277F|nr:helix-turn-helix domain-containing protein [Planobispora rosea]